MTQHTMTFSEWRNGGKKIYEARMKKFLEEANTFRAAQSNQTV